MRETELALRWLAEDGLTRDGDGAWWYVDAPGEPAEATSTADIAETWGFLVFEDERLGPADRVRVALGLMDLVGSHVLVHRPIHRAHLGPAGPLPVEVLWEGFRRRLEAGPEPEAVTDALWLDWFEHGQSADAAFTAVLGQDAHRIRADAPEGLLLRARRVLACSGPVPWATKEPAYRAAAQVPELRPAVFRAVLGSYHDLYGNLEPAAALALLDSLRLPPATAHLAALRTVLAAGHVNHRHAPDAWRKAADAPPR
ncbi:MULTISPECIES: hypothetical protein [unclassified Streptomyces]|uniref:hypothetical protein n=1 Tax=unclassified Streptomyces TaxID=2593676 RepID=UPI000DC7F008|nr:MULTISPECIES: hypothetical protein [unclassified Streptomyces]AWZ06316.1 hypothetical protein DRB89_18690 [Streptomyces sp. ICC4]AWZ15171.1 hypothetical protein DRB96_26215 [Streptomyces sp. ICC1]